MARTEQELDSRRREEMWQTCWCCRDHLRACRMAQASAKKLEHTGPDEKERVASVPQREQLASTPDPSLPKKKRNRVVCPEHQVVRCERVKVSESRTLASERGIRARAWSGNRYSTVKEGRFQEGKGGQAR